MCWRETKDLPWAPPTSGPPIESGRTWPYVPCAYCSSEDVAQTSNAYRQTCQSFESKHCRSTPNAYRPVKINAYGRRHVFIGARWRRTNKPCMPSNAHAARPLSPYDAHGVRLPSPQSVSSTSTPFIYALKKNPCDRSRHGFFRIIMNMCNPNIDVQRYKHTLASTNDFYIYKKSGIQQFFFIFFSEISEKLVIN